MKTWLLAIGLVWCGYSVLASNLILLGDSTLAKRTEKDLAGSWGESMTNKLAEGWGIVNAAMGGMTVKTVQGHEKRGWTIALKEMKKGDYVIVQFGINEAVKKKFVDIDEFKAELTKFADAIRAAEATPVFCSPITSGTYDKDGKFKRSATRDKYGKAVKELAAEKSIDFVDMTEITCKILGSMEKSAGEGCFVGQTTRKGKPHFDTTHPNKVGAIRFGEAFVAEVKERKLGIAKAFK